MDSITIPSPGKWYICAYSVDNANNTESKEIFGPYYLLEETKLIYVGNLSMIISNKSHSNFSAIFFRKFNTDFGFIFNYDGNYSLVFLNNLKSPIGSCDSEEYCDIYFYKTFYYGNSPIDKIFCTNNELGIYENNNLIATYSWPRNYGKIGFAYKNCYLGLIGITS